MIIANGLTKLEFNGSRDRGLHMEAGWKVRRVRVWLLSHVWCTKVKQTLVGCVAWAIQRLEWSFSKHKVAMGSNTVVSLW